AATTPDAGTSRVSRLVNAPRALKEPECCNSSSLKTRLPSATTGVRRTCGRISFSVAAISLRVTAIIAMMHTTLVSTQQLADHLREWRIFDCRHDLMKPDLGAQQYREAHIPGALFAHMEHNLSAPKTGKNGRHPLPDPATFAAWLGNQGLGKDDQVVCYDGANGSSAARLWWMLRWVGHQKVAV